MNHRTSSFLLPPSSFSSAFTLIELLVVIAIIATLASILMLSFGSSTEKVRMVKCATNLKNLAAAVGSYSMGGYYPAAQSYYRMETGSLSEDNATGVAYYHQKGWISWYDPDTRYPLKSPGDASQVSFSNDSFDEKIYALTNGAIWTAVGKNRDCYICPAFRKICEKHGIREPGWSYQMSAFFGYEKEHGKASAGGRVSSIDLRRADRRLLFAEIQALEITDKEKRTTGISSLPEVNLSAGDNDTDSDGCLVYKSKGGNESIGFNHRRGREIVGHVVFADGHVETLVAPRDGSFVELTDYLCTGKDYVYRDGKYEKIDN